MPIGFDLDMGEVLPRCLFMGVRNQGDCKLLRTVGIMNTGYPSSFLVFCIYKDNTRFHTDGIPHTGMSMVN